MATDVERLLDWAYNVEGRLCGLLDGLEDDLTSEDVCVRTVAETKASELLSWLLPPLTSEELLESREASIQRIQESLQAQGYPPTKTRRIAEKLAESNRDRGRPRERGPQAIRALNFHLKTGKTWREIALEINGPCRDRRCISFCPSCGDVARSVEPGRMPSGNGVRSRCLKCKFSIRSENQKQQICFRCVDQVRKLAEEAKAFAVSEGIWVPERRVPDTPGEK